MATTVNKPGDVRANLPGRRYDRQFFMTMVILLTAVVAIGFAPTYYLAGGFRAPLPGPIVHIHGAVFTSWMLLLLVQTGLVSAKKVQWHRKLGVAGFILACLMVVMAILTASNAMARAKSAPNSEAILGFLVVTFVEASVFAVLTASAYALRRNPAAHKRLILIATAGITGPAFFRWHVSFLYHDPYAAHYATAMFLVILAAYDLWSTHKIQRATLWGSGFQIFMEQITTRVVGPSAAWHGFAHWVQSLNI